jgi:hypothetical protein
MDVQIACICPPKGGEVRHPDGDTVTLLEALPFTTVSAIRWSIAIQRESDPRVTLAEQFGVISELYILGGVSGWTVVDEKGKPVEASKPEIRARLLTAPSQAQMVGDAADDLYQAVMLPLLNQASTYSPPSPKTESTSQPTGSPKSHRKPSSRSLTSITPTGATETTSSSLDGVSSASQSSATAA